MMGLSNQKNNRIRNAGLILGGVAIAALGGVAIYSELAAVDNAAAETKTSSKSVGVTNNAVIAISAPSSFDITLTPSASNPTLETKTGTISVMTNNATGYTLTVGMADGVTSTALANTYQPTTGSYTIPTLTAATTVANFPTNYWGYSTDYDGSASTGNFSPAPAIGSTATLKTTTAPASTSTTPFTLGVKADANLASGTYTNTVKFSAVTNIIPEPALTAVSPAYISAQDTSTKTITLTGTDLDALSSVKIGTADCTNITATSSTSATCEIGTNQGVLDSTTDFNEAGMSTTNPTMQSMTTTISDNTSTPTPVAVSINGKSTSTNVNYFQEITLTDTRDSKTYSVVKQADGKTWMTQNLDLDITTAGLTNADTDLNSQTAWNSSSTYAPSATETTTSSSSSYTGTKSWSLGDYYYDGTTATSCGTSATSYADCVGKGFAATGDSHYHVGNLYQWNTATAGTGGTITSQEATDSICPKNWRLPTSNTGGDFQTLSNAYGITSGTSTSGTVQKLIDAPLYMVRGGYVDSGTLRYAAYDGYYWSSTAYSNTNNAYYLYFDGTSYVSPSNNFNRYYGRSVRCVAR